MKPSITTIFLPTYDHPAGYDGELQYIPTFDVYVNGMKINDEDLTENNMSWTPSMSGNYTWYVVAKFKNKIMEDDDEYISTFKSKEETFTIENYPSISLFTNSVSLKVGETSTIDIIAGSGNYSIEKIEPLGVVTASVSKNHISIEAHTAGSATITVKDDNSGEKESIEVTVTDNEPSFETETFTVNGVSFNMVKVDGGTFMMGAPANDDIAGDYEKPQHKVTLNSYSIGQTEVTQELWKAVMGSNPSSYWGSNQHQRPVEQVSWYDCQRFIFMLNKLTGKKFSLPTEAEWEFASRGGNKSKGYTYSGSDNVSEVAWYNGNSGSSTHNVGTKAANELGIYDMSGNVWEWCQDYYDPYSNETQVSPTGPFTGTDYVLRGGSWNFSDWFCRSFHRNHDKPDHTASHLGFRLALSTNGGGDICESICPDDHHPHMIDLGLPSGKKWACCNVDAISPEDYGGYYAWFETEVKDEYSWSTYIHADGSEYSFHIDDLFENDFWTQNDVAHVKWGGSWSLPSQNDFKELKNNCIYQWTNRYGFWGAMFTSKKNGNCIFLPAAGFKSGIYRYEANSHGDYWSNSAEFDYEDKWLVGLGLSFSIFGSTVVDYEPYDGLTVRPVSK